MEQHEVHKPEINAVLHALMLHQYIKVTALIIQCT